MAKYKQSKQVQQAQKLKEQAEKAVKNYGSFKYGKQGAYDSAMDAILNRKAFSYDLNGDAFYQQYKDMYMSQGKQAMMDTMGQAAALTGGYGNSYAATVGNQAYQGYLQQLNGVVPELYNLALSAYNAEGDRLNNNFNLLSTDRNTQYGEWNDKYNRLLTDRGYYSDNYNNAYSQDYTRFRDAVADSRRGSGGGGGGGGGRYSTKGSDVVSATKTKNAEKFITTIPSRTGWGRANKMNADTPEQVAKNDKKYAQYVNTKIKDAYESGNLNDGELAYVLDYYSRQGVKF